MSDSDRFLPKVILPSGDGSGQPIMGGQPTRRFPDCCAVGSEAGYFCSGTLVAESVVISAAHCTNATRVFLKGHDVRAVAQGEIIEVATTHIHPSLDLMILVLDRPATVVPRHIARGPEVHGEAALLVGFGTIDSEGVIGFGIKREVEVVITSLDCTGDGEAEQYGCRPGWELVAGHRGLNRDTCRGDSGGPLYIQMPYGEYALLGATSRGALDSERRCGDGGVYTRVDRCLDWIAARTGLAL